MGVVLFPSRPLPALSTPLFHAAISNLISLASIHTCDYPQDD